MTLTDFLWQRGELVDVLARVLAAGHAEAKLEIKALQQLIAEVVPLNHAEVVDGCVSHCELHSAETQGGNEFTSREANENTNYLLKGQVIFKGLSEFISTWVLFS